MQLNEEILTLKYNIDRENFINYNMCMVDESLKKKRKKAYFVSAAEIITAVIFAGITLSSQNSENKSTVLILCFVLFLLGVFGAVFHYYMLPNSLKKRAEEQYEASIYKDKNVELIFNTDGFTHKVDDVQTKYRWKNINRIIADKTSYIIISEENKSIPIPKEKLLENIYMLEEIFTGISKKLGLSYEVFGGKN